MNKNISNWQYVKLAICHEIKEYFPFQSHHKHQKFEPKYGFCMTAFLTGRCKTQVRVHYGTYFARKKKFFFSSRRSRNEEIAWIKI
jgi:hypothetical protein